MRKPVMRICIAFITAAMLLPALGCQPNPTVPPVVGKGNLEDKIKDRTAGPSSTPDGAAASATGAATAASSMSAGPAAAPEAQRVNDSFSEGKLAVALDAAVELPAAGKLPVVKVTPRTFTQAEVDTFVKVLFQGKQPYKPKEKMTKDEINKQLIDMKAMKSQMKKGDKGLQKIDSAIAYYEEQLKTAPDKVDPEPSDGKFKVDEYGQQLYVTTALGKDTDATLDIYASKTGRTCSLWFTNENQGESYLGTDTKLSGQPRGVTITLDDARALAEKTARDLGSDLKLVNESLGTCRNMNGGGPDPNAQQAYLFAFAREVNGVPSTYESDYGGNVPQEEIDRADKGEKDFIEPHPYERIMMAINDSGILELQWISPDTMTGTVSEDALTIPFDQAMQTFQKQFFIHNALRSKNDEKPIQGKDGEQLPMPDYSQQLREAGFFTIDSIGYGEDVAKCTYSIDRIVLGLSRIAVKDKPDEFMIVPVWDFFGSVKVEYLPETGYTGFITTDAYKSFLTINAIDGSIINRSYGY